MDVSFDETFDTVIPRLRPGTWNSGSARLDDQSEILFAMELEAFQLVLSHLTLPDRKGKQ